MKPPPAGPRAALLLVALPALGCVSTVSAERAPAWRQQQALATLEDQEADGRVRLERWCGSALEAQAGRCAALQRLLVQTGLARTPPLQQLEADASALADSAERQRIAARLARSAAKQQLATAKLDAEDAAKDVDVFQRAEEQLGKANEYAKLLEPLISGARAEEHKRQAKLLLVQTHQTEDAGAIEASRLEREHGEKRKAISQNLQQRFTVERSMEVLTAALEDESAYLAELQTTCGLGKKVYQRLKEGPLVVLNVSLASIAERLRQSRQHPRSDAGAHDVVAMSAAPVAGNAQDEPVQEGGDHAPLTLAKALQALPANAPVAAEPQSQRPRPKTTVAAKAWPTSDGASSATVVEVKATSKTASATPMKHQAHKSVASRVASHARSGTDAPTAAAHSPKAPSRKTAAPQQPRPAAAHAPHVAARAPAGRLRKQAHAAVLTTPRPQAEHPADEPVAADQQKLVEHSAEQAEAGEALDAAAPLEEASAQPAAAPARRHRGHRAPKGAKKSKDSQFMDGVYDSASGNMPSEYSAWTPDGSAPAAEQHAPASSDGSPTKRMLAILGDDSSAKPSPSVEGPHDAAHKAPSTHLRRSQASKAKPLASHATPTKAAEQEDTSAAALSTASKADSDDGLSAGVKAKASVQRDADVDGDDDASELADASTAPKTPKPHAKAVALKSTRGTGAASDASDGDADESSAPSSRAKKEDAESAPDPPAEKESEQLGFDNDEAIDKAFPTPKLSVASLSAQKMQRAAGRGSLVQKAAASKPRRDDIAGAVNLPTQYSAWSPTDEKAPAKKETSLEQMVADFKNDDTDDEEEVAAPPRRGQQQRRAGGSGGPGPAAAKPPQKAAASHSEEADVVYDDDDLPRHHKRPISMDLQGGWKSFIMKGAAASKAHKAKVDPDVAIMNSLYANDGGLPKQYTAWSPSAGDADQGAPAQASDDLKAAARELEGEASFTQLSSVTLGLSPMERLIRQAVEDAAGSGDAVRAEIAPLVFLEESATVSSNASRASVANAVLEQYSKALRSQTLSQLAHAKLSQPKLAELWQRLQKVDPLSHAGAAAPPGKRQAQAERWCQYFMQNEQSAAPVHKAVALVEKDSNALAESASQRAAMTEEANARQQLLRTVDQDVSSLSALLNATRQEQHASALSLSKEDLMAFQNIDLKGATDLMAFEGAVEAFQAGHAEAADLLEATLTKRVAVLEAQRAKLANLEKDMKAADQAVQQKQAVLTQSTKSVSAAQKQLGGIHSSCDATLSGLHRRQHSGHMEAHAVEVALKVLGSH